MVQYFPVTTCCFIHPAYILSSAATMADLFIWTCMTEFFVTVIVFEEVLCCVAFCHFSESKETDVSKSVLVKAIEITRINISIGFNNIGNLTSAKHTALVWGCAL